MGNWLLGYLAIAVICTIARRNGTIGRPYEAILEKVVQDDYQVAEKLVNGLLADGLASRF